MLFKLYINIVVLNKCYISEVSQLERFQTAKRPKSLVLVPFDRPYDFLLVCHCNYLSILYHFRYIITHLPKFKDVT